MATSANTSVPLWLSGATYDASSGNDLRQSHIAATYLDTGILTGSTIGVRGGVTGGAGLGVSAASGMNVTVGPGSFVVPNTATPVAGGYSATLAQSETFSVEQADPSNPRIDIVVANVVDNGNNTSLGQVQIITGTPGASPSAPSAPANSITLAQVNVAPNVTSIVAGNITDTRPFTVAAGGVLPAAKGSVSGYTGMVGYDTGSGSFYHNSASGSTQFRVLPWPPQYVTHAAADFGLASTTQTTICSTNITTDGYTDIRITYHIPGLYQNTVAVRQVIFTAWLDGNQLTEIDLMTHSDDLAGISHSGFTDVYTTSSESGDTPSAGAHTVYFKGAYAGTTDGVWVKSTATRNVYLRVEPVVL